MRCRFVKRRLSAYVEADLDAAGSNFVAAHVRECAGCAGLLRSLRRNRDVVAELPRPASRESLVARVLERVEAERRGPGLAVFRTFLASRPLILPSLVPAVFVLATVLSGAILLDGGRQPTFRFAEGMPGERSADSGTESNPLFPSSDVGLPRSRGRRLVGVEVSEAGEGSFFLETVIARDGTVSAVTLLDGDSSQARPIVDALLRERFEPVRLNGRRVAVSVYRLISRLEVRPPLT